MAALRQVDKKTLTLAKYFTNMRGRRLANPLF